jgi:hypothetical protein
VKILIAARDLLQRKRWIRGAHMSVRRGKHVTREAVFAELIECSDRRLVGLCASGAITRVSGSLIGRAVARAYIDEILQKHRRFISLIDFNDKVAKGKEDILRLFNEAIVLAKESRRKSPKDSGKPNA